MSDTVAAAGVPEPDVAAQVFYEDMVEGASWTSPRRTITEADISAFAGISGDFNPLHVDQVFAEAGPFGRRIAHGMLTLSIATGLRQQMGIFRGTLKAFLEIRSWRFAQPVFARDTVVTTTTVVSARATSRPDQGVVVQRVDVVNQAGDVVASGEFVTLMRRRVASPA